MKRKFIVLFATLALSAGALAQTRSAWDAVGDYSLSVNPHGAWSYHMQAPAGALNPLLPFAGFDCGIADGVACWNRRQRDCLACPDPFTGDWQLPLVGVNTTDRPIEFAGGVVPNSALLLHPGPVGQRAMVMWTAPADGRYVAAGYFQLVGRSATGVRAIVGVGETEVLNKPLSAFGQTVAFRLTRRLKAGQTFSFAIDPEGDSVYDATALKAGVMRLD